LGKTLRLFGGRTPYEGRVEVYHNGVWGTICDDGWTAKDTAFVCEALGLSPQNASAVSGSPYGVATGPIHLDDVSCVGNESRIDQCRHNGWGNHNCGHSEDVSVNCSAHFSLFIFFRVDMFHSSFFNRMTLSQKSVSEITTRLAGGKTPYEGRVEVYHNGEWGSVCNDDWDGNDAAVICRSLGFPWQGAQSLRWAFFGQGLGPIYLDDVSCNGREKDIQHCANNGIGRHNCDHKQDVSVRCLPFWSITTRLVGGQTPYEGRVEVSNNGIWGTVCDDGWDDKDAAVVCRSLGYPTQNAASSCCAHYGQGSGPIHLDIVSCNGTETDIGQCPNLGWGIHNCGHHEDASVSCSP
ncbi:neurotrypsin-like, partial [Saccostrea cucullata]|uniref:neurotrypsin-like n=1 Tax=Saccostrea cuccullata TaxID=36930 RepID=UPI002ED51683